MQNDIKKIVCSSLRKEMFTCLNDDGNMFEFIDQAIKCKNWSDLLYVRKVPFTECVSITYGSSLCVSKRVGVDFDHALKCKYTLAKATITRMIDNATFWLTSNNDLNETLLVIDIENYPGDKTCVE